MTQLAGGALDCPSDDVLTAHVEGRLDRAQADVLARHLETCGSCRDLLVSWLAARSKSGEGTRAVDALGGSSDLLPATRVGRYSILAPVGSGGMGVVYAAFDPELSRKVALKLLHVAEASDQGTSRLHREAQAMARVSHPNVLAVYDVGLHEGRVFIVMEYVEGATLRGWLAGRERPWREIVRVFSLAGNGLHGAHRAGLVHADFKPDNVLVGQDDRVFVADFGLTRTVDHGREGAGSRSTTASTLRGTPAYMAPEVLEGAQADAKSDQFSYCLAVAEALAARRFSPKNALEEWEAAAARLPRSLRSAVARGLSRDPEGRFPSMDALVRALGGRRTARAGIIAAAAVSVVLGASAVAVAKTSNHATAQCTDVPATMESAWGPERKRAVASAFSATTLPFARAAFDEVERSLDTFRRDWMTGRVEACRATRVRHESSEAVFERRAACFDRRLRELDTITRIFASADADVVTNSATAISRLAPAISCLDERAQGGPIDPRVDQLRLTLAEAKALEDVGRIAPGLTLATDVAKKAHEIPSRALKGEALLRRGVLEAQSGDDAIARTTLEDAIDDAEAAGDDESAIRAWSALVEILGRSGKFEDGGRAARRAQALLDRTDNHGPLRANLLTTFGSLRLDEGKAEESERLTREALAIEERTLEPTHLQIAQTLTVLANAISNRGKPAEAAATFRRALDIYEKRLGETHPEYAKAHAGLGFFHWDSGHYDEAIAAFRRALTIGAQARLSVRDEAAITQMLGQAYLNNGALTEATPLLEHAIELETAAEGADHPTASFYRHSLGFAYLQAGRYSDAIAQHTRALAVREKEFGAGNPLVANSHQHLGYTLLLSGDAKRALAEYRMASDVTKAFRNSKRPDHSSSLLGLGKAYLALGDVRNALPLLEEALAIREARNERELTKLPEARAALAAALLRGHTEEARARQLATEARTDLVAMGKPGAWELRVTRILLGRDF